MQTNFTTRQLADPATARAEQAVRRCVHCGFCLSVCPTYTLLGDELDSPRGRIYLMKHMLETGEPPSAEAVRHVDRCLSCLACETTCPSGVSYRHLIDRARAHIARSYRRPWVERALRRALLFFVMRPRAYRLAALAARAARPVAMVLPGPLKTMTALAAAVPLSTGPRPPALSPAVGRRRMRVLLLTGCVQSAVGRHINAAAIAVLTRSGADVVAPTAALCCGSLAHHMGATELAHRSARKLIDQWTAEIEAGGVDAVVSTTSGCGATLKDYGEMFDADPDYAEKAQRIAALSLDFCEVADRLDFKPAVDVGGVRVAYHAPCSLQHGQRLAGAPEQLLSAAGFAVARPAEAHMCCGSAGVYNVLQSEIAARLGERRAAHIDACEADIAASSNLGCMLQIARASRTPFVHIAELLDWASGGPRPPAIADRRPA